MGGSLRRDGAFLFSEGRDLPLSPHGQRGSAQLFQRRAREVEEVFLRASAPSGVPVDSGASDAAAHAL